MNKKFLTTILGLVLACGPAFSEDSAYSDKKSEKQKKEISQLDGSVYAGYEYDGTSDYWSMAIKTNDENKEFFEFEVVWTKPLSTIAPPYDHNYRNAEKLVLTSNDGKKVKFIRPNCRQYYEAELDSNGNIINGTVTEIESGKTFKSVWKLLKVK